LFRVYLAFPNGCWLLAAGCKLQAALPSRLAPQTAYRDTSRLAPPTAY